MARQIIGIVGGAGPMAGAVLQQKLIEQQQSIGCWQDYEFAEVISVQFPFTSTSVRGIKNDKDNIREVISVCKKLTDAGATTIVFACNSLYVHRQHLKEVYGFNIIDHIGYSVSQLKRLEGQKITVLSSVSSCESKLFDMFETCNVNTQSVTNHQRMWTDTIISEAMKGRCIRRCLQQLLDDIGVGNDHKVYLACTELCLSSPFNHTINSLDLMAKNVLTTNSQENR